MSDAIGERTFAVVPVHIGIIMDGNGRWAELKKSVRSAGHRQGLKAAKRIVRTASNLGVRYLTLYSFSTENWVRNRDEVGFLMRLIGQNLRKEYDFYREQDIRVVHTGDPEQLPTFVRKEIQSVTEDTAQFNGMVLNLAINYGGRDEIVRSVNRWLALERAGNGESASVSPEDIAAHLDQPSLPDPDLIIRTAGEQRLSNFLLWESAYSEFYFSSKLWPDWTAEDLYDAIEVYSRRKRKYGGVH